MTLNLSLKKNYKILNIIFLLIPIIFLLPVYISNIFCVVYLSITLYSLKKNDLKVKIDNLDKIFLIFFFIIIASSLKETFYYDELVKENLTYDIISKISIIRFFVVYLLTKNILQYNLVRIENFFKISTLCTVFISTNIILMHLIGADFFGNKEIANRFSTIFGERAIAGTYLLNFFFFSFIFFYLKKENTFLKHFFIILTSTGILLSFDRAPFLYFLIFYFFICLLNLKKDFKLTIMMIIIFLMSFFLIFKYEKLYTRYAAFVLHEVGELKQIIHYKENKDYVDYYSYASIYKDSINTIFFEKTLFGSGKSSFYSRCRDYRIQTDVKSIIDGYAYACPKHTHHLYLEILISGGILSFLLFLIIIIIKLYLFTKNILQKKNSPYYAINSILLAAFIVEIFPFRTYGEIFNSYNGLFFFFKISIIYGITKYNLLKIKNNT